MELEKRGVCEIAGWHGTPPQVHTPLQHEYYPTYMLCSILLTCTGAIHPAVLHVPVQLYLQGTYM